jgi:hypothetical protein
MPKKRQQTKPRRDLTCDMPFDDGCKWADMSAHIAVQKTFAILGVDVEDPISVESFRKDLRFGGDLRKMSEKGKLATVILVVTFIVSAIGYGLLEFAKHKIGNGH